MSKPPSSTSSPTQGSNKKGQPRKDSVDLKGKKPQASPDQKSAAASKNPVVIKGKKDKNADKNTGKVKRDGGGGGATSEEKKSSSAKSKRRKAGGGDDDDKKKKKKSGKRLKQTGCFSSLLAMFGLGSGNVQITDNRAIEAVQALNLQPWHLRRLKGRFDVIDVDHSGNIDATEFFEACGEQRSPFTDKLFALIDLDGSGTIEFDEYVRVMATYCMFSKDEILRFCFECFDIDSSGTIDEKEFMELCKTVNNASPTFPGNFRKALEEFDVNEDGLIDYGEFMEIDRRYPLVLFPAFRLQDTMQKNSLGETAWVKVIEEYNRQKLIEDYKASHGGKLPPDPPLKMIGKLFCPCFFGSASRSHIKLGADMENRHRDKN